MLCFINPCFFSSCPNSPSARCVPSFCGGCNAHYFDDDGNNVTDSCRTRETCPDGSELLRCFLDPCEVVSCPGNPTARCVSNFCGNCSYIFVDSSNNDVTSSCGNTRSQGMLCTCALLYSSEVVHSRVLSRSKYPDSPLMPPPNLSIAFIYAIVPTYIGLEPIPETLEYSGSMSPC